MRTTLIGVAFALLAAACGGDGESTGPGGAGGTSPSTSSSTSSSSTSSTSSSTSTSSGSGGGAGTLTTDIAASICGALARCCDAASETAYFAPFAGSSLLASFTASIPPAHAFASEAECAATVKQMLDIVPFGDWAAAVDAGRVTFDAAAFSACKGTLDGAACGNEVASALGDGTCFGFAPPPGGPLQRKMFHRTGKTGDPCAPIRDGIGAGFFGNCDPTAFFCCYADPASPGKCALPFDANGKPRQGMCKAASKAGEGCAVLGSVQICVTGTSCDGATDLCVADGTTPLALGAPCVDGSFNLLGICQSSYCDILGSGKCEALKADGSTCAGGEECQSASCSGGKCGASTFCVGP